MNPFKPTNALAEVLTENRRSRFATTSRRNAWFAVALSYLFLGFVAYQPAGTRAHPLAGMTVAPAAALNAFSLISSIYVVLLTTRFIVAKIFAGICVLMNVGLMAILAAFYWLLNYSDI